VRVRVRRVVIDVDAPPIGFSRGIATCVGRDSYREKMAVRAIAQQPSEKPTALAQMTTLDRST
jgi:hypothetical protein